MHSLCSCAKTKQGSSVLQKSHWEGILSVSGSITHKRIRRFKVQFYQAGENRKLPIVKYHGSFVKIPVCHKPSVHDRISEPFPSLKHSAADAAVVTALSVFWQVNPIPYYESCVSDFCGCDSVGDCECFCTSVAAYSRSCSRAGVCVNWRTPAICRKFCTGMHTESSAPCAQAHRGHRRAEHWQCYASVTEQALFIMFILLTHFKQDFKIVPAQCLRLKCFLLFCSSCVLWLLQSTWQTWVVL